MNIRMKPVLFLLIILLSVLNLSTQVYAVSSASKYKNDSVVIEYDRNFDYCAAAWEKVRKQTPEKFKTFSLDYKGKVSLTPKALFEYTCNQCKDSLEAEIKGVIETVKKETDLKAKAQQRLNQAKSELRNAFLAWVAETARPHILPLLSKKDQKKFQTDSAFMQSKAIEYLDSEKELMAYISAYLQQNSPVLFKAQKAYFDLTSGESAAIIKDLKTLIETAKGRLEKINSLAEDAVEDPKTPWADLIKKHGVKGEWIDRVKEHEGQLSGLNEKFKIKELVDIIHKSSSSDLPRHKVEAMFEFLDTVSGMAADSHIPMASLMAGFVQDLVKVGKELLSKVVILGENIHKRAGYCLGTGVAAEDPRSAELDKKGLTLCPLGFEKKPWKDIYTELDSNTDRLHFWDGKKFIPGRKDGGGKTSVQNIIKFVTRAQEHGYDIDRKISTIAALYNVPFKAGFRGLESHAATVMEDITQKALEYREFKKNIFGCTSDRLSSQLQNQFDFNFDAFLKQIDTDGTERLETVYIAAYLASQGRLGKKNKERTAAKTTYDRIQKEIKFLRFIHIAGNVVDENNPDGACQTCENIKLDITLSGAEEVRGCEIWKTDINGLFNAYLFTKSSTVSIALKASTKGKTSGKVSVDTKKSAIYATLMIPFENSSKNTGQDIALPDLSGMIYEKAVARLEKLNLVPSGPEIGTPAPNKGQTGHVEKTSPRAGSRLRPDSSVTLFLFDEPASIAQVPDLTGLDSSSAKKKVQSSGLVAVIKEGKEAQTPEKEGEVYNQEPESGFEVLPGSQVVLTVYSAGELMGTVPDLMGTPVDKAVGLVRQMGLTPSVELGKETQSKSFENKIYKQDPAPGTQTTPGSQVTVWIYDYKSKTFIVPDLIGKKAQTALDLIKAAGLNPVFELGKNTSDANRNEMVYSQSPKADSATQKGADVVLTVYNYEQKTLTVPNILGMSGTKGAIVLLDKSFEILPHSKGKPAPQKKDEGKIYRQFPNAGQSINPGEKVEFWYYDTYQATEPRREPPILAGGVPFIDIKELSFFDTVRVKLFKLTKNKKDYYESHTVSKRPGQFVRPRGGFIYKKETIRVMHISYSDSKRQIGGINVSLLWREPPDAGNQNYVRFCKKNASGKAQYFEGGKPSTVFLTSPSGKKETHTIYSATRIDFFGRSHQVQINVTGAEKSIRKYKNELMKMTQDLANQIVPYAKKCQ